MRQLIETIFLVIFLDLPLHDFLNDDTKDPFISIDLYVNRIFKTILLFI